MNCNKIFFYLLLCFFFLQCKENESSYFKEIKNLIENELGDGLKEYDMVYIIPGSGCTGCINSAEKYFFGNVKNERKKFIFTYNFSTKNLVLKLKKENIEQKNVLIDEKNIFYLDQHKENIYPIAIEIVDGKVSKVSYL